MKTTPTGRTLTTVNSTEIYTHASGLAAASELLLNQLPDAIPIDGRNEVALPHEVQQGFGGSVIRHDL